MASPGAATTPAPIGIPEDPRDTVIVPAQQDGFDEVFLGQSCWHAIRIGGGMPQPIPFADATTGSMQGPRYTSLTKLLSAKRVANLFT